MKYSLAGFLLLLSAHTFGQLGVTENFQKINSLEQAQQFIAANPRLKPALLTLSADKDTTIIGKRLLRQNKGDVFSVGYVTYKVLESAGTTDHRANYIFIDGTDFTDAQLDSLKKLVAQKIVDGVSFETLSRQYNMDGNQTNGDTDWFSGEFSFPKEFQDAVQQHKLGEVFFVDLPEKKWHYIVKKTHDDRVKKEMTVLRAIGR